MYEKINVVKLSKKSIPIRCDIKVLSALQEEFGSVNAFQQKLIGASKSSNSDELVFGEPNIHAIDFALRQMIPEGIAKAIEQNEEYPDIDWRESIDDFDFNYIEVALALHEEFQRCFLRKKKTNMNPQRKVNQKKSTSTES